MSAPSTRRWAASLRYGGEDARGVEARSVANDDDRLALLLSQLDGRGDDGRVRRAVGDDLQERHLLHRAEVVHPDDVSRPLAPLGEPGDGDGAGVRGEDAGLGRGGLHLGEEPALEAEVLEDGLDDHVRSVEARQLGRRGDPRQHLLQPAPVESSPPDALVEEAPDVRQRPPHRGIVALLDPDRELGLLGGDEGDAASHETPAEHRDLPHRSRLRRTVHPGVLLQGGGGEEQLAEPSADLGGEQLAERAGLGA